MIAPEVNTIYGKIRGSEQKSFEGIDFYAFKGIPYAKPPVRELRFKDPERPEPWTSVLDATEFASMCAQFDIFNQTVGGSDDCLYLNVYTKSIDPHLPQPVMFYVHGGGFFSGSGNDSFYGPDYFMKKDIVLVTINYRLGILGFLNLEHEVAPGNQGLKDQVMALEWVRDNIENFGGDPNNVTIFGESAGGAAIHYLTLSPLTKGLFHKAISHSGVAINPWGAVAGDPKLPVYKICKSLGKETTNPREIVEFLNTVDLIKLNQLIMEIETKDIKTNFSLTFGPCVDIKSPRPFMPLPVEVAARRCAHIPYIFGVTDREGSFGLIDFETSTDPETKEKVFERTLHPRTRDMLKNNNLHPDELKRLYFKNGKITFDNLEVSTDFMGDLLFVHGTHEAIKNQVEGSSAPTYFYQFAYDQGYSIVKLMNKQPNKKGAAHMDDLIYLFRMKFFENLSIEVVEKDTNNYKLMEQMIELWTNFAKTGNPTYETSELLPVRWLPVNNGTVLRYLHIGEDLRMEKMLNIDERFSYKKEISEKSHL